MKNLTNEQIIETIDSLQKKRKDITRKIQPYLLELRKRNCISKKAVCSALPIINKFNKNLIMIKDNKKNPKKGKFQYFSRDNGKLNEYSKEYRTKEEAKKWYEEKGRLNNVELELLEI